MKFLIVSFTLFLSVGLLANPVSQYGQDSVGVSHTVSSAFYEWDEFNPEELLSIQKDDKVNLLERDEAGFSTIDYLVSGFVSRKLVSEPYWCLFRCPEQAPHYTIEFKKLKPCLRNFDTDSVDQSTANQLLRVYASSPANSHYSSRLNCRAVKKFLSSKSIKPDLSINDFK